MRIIYYIFSVLLLGTEFCHSQSETEKKLANQYFQNAEYEKAALLYESLHNASGLIHYYNYYLDCLLKINDYKKAEKLAKKEIKRNSNVSVYKVDLGYVYQLAGENQKSKQQYEKALKEINNERQQYVSLANAFLKKNEIEFAIKTYLKGKKNLPKENFYMQLANVYSKGNHIEKMLDEYLDLLTLTPSKTNQIQNILQFRIFENPDLKSKEILRSSLIKRIQKSPSNTEYNEMLIWYYIQEKEFQAAYSQAKSIDKRNRENGKRLIELGKTCVENKAFTTAINCYKYIIEKGSDNYFYITSKVQLLNVLNIKITQSEYSPNDLAELERNYISTINEIGRHASTIQLSRELAHLYAFYLNQIEKAITTLNSTLKTKNIKPKDVAMCKLELADILLLKGEVWDASLYYSQVEKSYKHEPIGHKAKYKNAKLYYYVGQFEWAQAQLDVLKASTSKLIANDAMDLSLLISDNLALDTSTFAMQIFARADLKTFQNKNNEALIIYDSILNDFPNHTLTDEIYFEKASIYIHQNKIDKAITHLEKITQEYNYDILADDALYKLAWLYDYKKQNKSKAMELYQKLLSSYSGSIYVVEARKRYRLLRGDWVN